MIKSVFLVSAWMLFILSPWQRALSKSIALDDLSRASWISDGKAPLANDSLYYLDDPAPQFRKEFVLDGGSVDKAILQITAAGYYTATLNGARIGDAFLDPAWTDYRKRIYYSEYEVTSLLTPEKNCLGVVLGNGFYNPLPLRMWGHRNLREALPVGRPAFLALLVVTFTDGRQQTISTDTSWKYEYGPIIRNSVYLGVRYDARKELDHWDAAGYDDSHWRTAKQTAAPGGRLLKAFFPAIKTTDRITPVAITEPHEGIYLIDMGVNFAGICSLHLRGASGDTVILRYGERVYADGELNPMTAVCGQIKRAGQGGPGAPAIAWQSDSYIFGRNPDVWFTPDFTFHTFRYVEMAGLKYQPQLADVQGFAMNTAVSTVGTFDCSSALLNQIQKMVVRTFKSNLQSVQSDCPARERFGYGGDLNAVGESYVYHFDMQSFYRKTVLDWVDAMKDSSFVDTAPFVGIEYCGISWESAFLLTQYNLLLYYNDLDFIKEMYPLDLHWMQKVARIHPNGIVEKGLSDHEALQGSPVQLTGSLHYLQCARIMARFSRIMQDGQNERKFKKLAESLVTKIRDQFWYQPVDANVNRQTLFASLLYHNIIPPKDQQAARDSLQASLRQGPAGHFSTGIFGTKYVLEAASSQAMVDDVFAIVNSTIFPGWGFMVDRGATTLWETWKESEDVYSNCHPMFGSVSEWFYRWLAGLQPDPEFPGFEKFFLCPHTTQGLDSVACSYRSLYGVIKSNWKKSANRIVYEIDVPPASMARFQIPVGRNSQVRVENLQERSGILLQNRKTMFQHWLKPGSYRITCITKEQR